MYLHHSHLGWTSRQINRDHELFREDTISCHTSWLCTAECSFHTWTQGIVQTLNKTWLFLICSFYNVSYNASSLQPASSQAFLMVSPLYQMRCSSDTTLATMYLFSSSTEARCWLPQGFKWKGIAPPGGETAKCSPGILCHSCWEAERRLRQAECMTIHTYALGAKRFRDKHAQPGKKMQ